MRLKRPRPASPDQIRISREDDTAVIEYADPSIRGVHLRVGPVLATMTDADVLELFNGMLEAQDEVAAGVDPTLTEIPPGLPQIEYHEKSNQWVPRGQVLRCHIEDDAEGGRGHSHRRCGTGPRRVRADAPGLRRVRDAHRLCRRGGGDPGARDSDEGTGQRVASVTGRDNPLWRR